MVGVFEFHDTEPEGAAMNSSFQTYRMIEDEHGVVVTEPYDHHDWEITPLKNTRLPHGIRVSSVFLGMTHGEHDGKPLLFETMVFNSVDPYERIPVPLRSTDFYACADIHHEQVLEVIASYPSLWTRLWARLRYLFNV